MFTLISDVPAALSEFYVEDVRSEPTGNMIDEPYTYLDNDGVEQEGTRPVPEYAAVTYIVQVNFGEVKSWADVERVISLNKPQSVVETFVKLAIAGDKQRFHDAYIEWLESEPREDDEKYQELDGNEQPIYSFELDAERWLEAEPTYTATDASIYLMQSAKAERSQGRYAPITVDGLTFDATQEAYDNLQGMVSSWEIMIADQALIDSGLVVGDQMYWTLADNSNALVTKEMLQSVVTAIRVRAGLLHAQYQANKAAAGA